MPPAVEPARQSGRHAATGGGGADIVWAVRPVAAC